MLKMLYNCIEFSSKGDEIMDANMIADGIGTIAAHPWIIAAAVAVLLLIFFLIFKTSIKIAFKVLINAVIGFILLFVFNGLGSVIGVTLAFNWVNAIVAGILGIPGIALLLILRWLGVM